MSNAHLLNRDFAKLDEQFRSACRAAGIEPTVRQASRWRQKTGKAWKWYLDNHRNGHAARVDMDEENRNS